jgi:hypothetical protein
MKLAFLRCLFYFLSILSNLLDLHLFKIVIHPKNLLMLLSYYEL